MTAEGSDLEVIKVGAIMIGARGELDLWLKAGKAEGLTLCRLRSGPKDADFEIVQTTEIRAFEKEIARLRCMGTAALRRYNMALASPVTPEPVEQVGEGVPAAKEVGP